MVADPVMHNSDGVSLRDYFDERHNDLQRTIDKAESVLNLRLNTMNEFREQLKDQAVKFITRDEILIQLSPMLRDIEYMKRVCNIVEGKASSLSMLITAGMSLIGLFLAVIDYLK
jgi:hypothetical protein